MSFVFDQIDAIDRERSDKDEALQRIRLWREQKRKNQASVSESGQLGDAESSSESGEKKKDNIFATKEIEVVHPWPEWIELMERLVQQNYFDHRRKDEDGMVPNFALDDVGGLGFVEEGFDFTRDWTTVRTACLNFGRDRFDILRLFFLHWISFFCFDDIDWFEFFDENVLAIGIVKKQISY